MPFLTDDELGGGFLPRTSTEAPKPEEGGVSFSTAAKVAAPVAVGAGLVFAPALTLGAIAAAGTGAYVADPEGTATNFRINNPVSSYLASKSVGADRRVDEGYDPWAEIADTPYMDHWDRFTDVFNPDHAAAVKADIDRETKDRAYLEAQGPIGIAEGLAAGLLDPTNLLPFGGAVRSAKGGYSLLKSAGSVAAYSAGGAAASEAMLQATQQTRTLEESAYAIGGATILGGVLGASIAGKMTRAELDALGRRVEADLARGPDDAAAPAMADQPRPDPMAPDGAAELAPETSRILDSHSQDTDALTSELKSVAERILPDSVRLSVVESLDAAGAKAKDDALYGLRAYHGSPHDFDRFDMSKIGTGEGAQAFGYGLYFAENTGVAVTYRDALSNVVIDGKIAEGFEKSYGAERLAGTLDRKISEYQARAQRLLSVFEPKERAANRIELNDLLTQLETMRRVSASSDVRREGNLYEVELNVEPELLLDWDKRLSQQSLHVQNALKSRFGDFGTWTGKDIYEAMIGAGTAEDASRALREAGIPGIRYLDQGSRGAEEGTRNIVIFDDSLVKITAKNGKPVTAAQRKAVVDEMFSVRSGGDVTQTPEFKNWFGDSKVVDESGKPLVVYHGPAEEFEAFDKSMVGSEFNQDTRGFFFTDKRETAEGYARNTSYGLPRDKAAPVVEAYLSIKNPLIERTDFDPITKWDEEHADIQARATAGGHDGIIIKADKGESLYIAFEPTQIKSTSNRGTFDPADPRMNYGMRGSTVEGKYDPAQNLITIARTAADPVSTLHHEAVHALKNMGLFTPREWKALENAAKAKGWMDVPEIAEYARIYQKEGPEAAKRSLRDRKGVRQYPLASRDEWYGDANYQQTGGRMIEMTPDEYLAKARPMEVDEVARDNIDDLKRHIQEGGVLDPLALYKNGKEDGRHRAHAAKELGIKLVPVLDFRDKDLLSVRSSGEAKRLDISKLPPDLQRQLTEEAIAMAYQRWIRGVEPQKGVIGSAFARVRKFLDAVKSALQGKGFNTPEDIFARIDSGQVAARARSAEDAARAKATRPGSVGASAKASTDDRLKGALGLEKAMARMSPGLWLQNSPSKAARAVISELGETGTYLRNMADWTPAANEGAEMGQYGAVESRVKVFQGRDLAEGFTAIDDAFMKYRKGESKRRIGDLTVTSLSDAMLGSGDKMDFRQFREAVGEAMASGDTHPVPEVAGLAKQLRPIFDRWKDEAIKTGLLPEGVSVQTAASYMMRVYNRKKIIARRDEFKAIIVSWLGEVEKANARVREQLVDHVEELKGAEADVARTEEKIAKRAAAEKKAAASAKKAGRERADNSEEIALKDEEDKAFIAERQARVKELEGLIEEQVELYQGKTAAAAKSALEARRQADAARDPAKAKREQRILKPVREAAESIAAQEPKTAAELPGLADEIIDRILSTPEGRLPYDAASNKVKHAGVDMDARGPLAARVFMIPDKLISAFLERDIDTLLRSYLHTMVPDIELAKRFGTPDMMLQVKKITEDYAALSAQAKTPSERLKLHRQRDEDIRNVAAIRDRLRGTYKVPEDPEAIMLRTARTALTLSFLSKLGGMTVSAITDPARFFSVHGSGAFADGFIPLFRNVSNFRMAGREAVQLAGALELINDSRALRMADISDTWGANTKFERLVQSGGRNFGMVSMMAPWNATMKQTAAVMAQNRILRNAVKVANGSKLSRKETEFMAFLALSEGVTRKIGEQFKAKGVKKSGLYFANAADWSPDARNAKDAMSAALRKIVDFTIITPGQTELPKFASTTWGKLLLQFKSFSISATNKMLIAGLQQRDAAAVSGALMSLALGGLVYILKMEAAGKPAIVPKSFDDPNWKIFMGEAFDRSGLAGVLMEGNNIMEKVSRGKIGLSALTGKPISRYASRNVMQSVAGPVIGMAEDAAAVAGSIFDDREWTQKDTHRIRQMLPYQNLFYLRSAFDQVEKGLNEKFGIRERAAR